MKCWNVELPAIGSWSINSVEFHVPQGPTSPSGHSVQQAPVLNYVFAFDGYAPTDIKLMHAMVTAGLNGKLPGQQHQEGAAGSDIPSSSSVGGRDAPPSQATMDEPKTHVVGLINKQQDANDKVEAVNDGSVGCYWNAEKDEALASVVKAEAESSYGIVNFHRVEQILNEMFPAQQISWTDARERAEANDLEALRTSERDRELERERNSDKQETVKTCCC